VTKSTKLARIFSEMQLLGTEKAKFKQSHASPALPPNAAGSRARTRRPRSALRRSWAPCRVRGSYSDPLPRIGAGTSFPLGMAKEVGTWWLVHTMDGDTCPDVPRRSIREAAYTVPSMTEVLIPSGCVDRVDPRLCKRVSVRESLHPKSGERSGAEPAGPIHPEHDVASG
jgi:hypothetical protein